ncbi:DUF4266 domain-containing protein [Hyunsoonleella sp. SJ7]|uniref:DUF4266 domain-containing protein n=1 Tax=Hyunsoonleella aquatilis TaxID=2762758 RepID=A0A923HHM1_9FLAO|nr:DUF4266 domain-containing protein [Hyunsoonleella aquatilis]MBC3759480.1 DUF4266 domain-containing protein [Hyunsoonleella aquatilis]
MKILWLSLLSAILLSSCKTVKPYERQYVSDPEMQMQNDAGRNFNLYVQSIREGATPVGSAKGSGGCGCN